jgi:hypothetical protein
MEHGVCAGSSAGVLGLSASVHNTVSRSSSPFNWDLRFALRRTGCPRSDQKSA